MNVVCPVSFGTVVRWEHQSSVSRDKASKAISSFFLLVFTGEITVT